MLNVILFFNWTLYIYFFIFLFHDKLLYLVSLVRKYNQINHLI